MKTEYTLRDRIDKLARGLKSFSPKLGYSEVQVGGRVTQFKVHDLAGDREIPVHAGKKLAALEELLRQMENLARHYKPSLLLPEVRHLPLWLTADARAFASRATARDKGKHRFGKPIDIPGAPVPGLGPDLVAKRTKEQIVYVSVDSIEAFRYFPIEETKYKDSVLFKAAMDWNRSMFDYVEKQGFAPSVARDKLISVNRELIRRLILELALPGTSDIISTSGDVLKNVVTIIIRW